MAANANYDSDPEDYIPEIDLTIDVDIEPYQYEPRRSQATFQGADCESDEDTDSESDDDDDPPPTDMDWCTCGNCALMPTGKECRCCTSFSAVDDRRESQQLTCITDHPGFEGNCLNRWVLETSYYEFIQDEGPLDADQLIHEAYRYLAYRRFARWIWRRLGKKNRKILPACVVSRIRDNFPSQQYCGFRYPE